MLPKDTNFGKELGKDAVDKQEGPSRLPLQTIISGAATNPHGPTDSVYTFLRGQQHSAEVSGVYIHGFTSNASEENLSTDLGRETGMTKRKLDKQPEQSISTSEQDDALTLHWLMQLNKPESITKYETNPPLSCHEKSLRNLLRPLMLIVASGKVTHWFHWKTLEEALTEHGIDLKGNPSVFSRETENIFTTRINKIRMSLGGWKNVFIIGPEDIEAYNEGWRIVYETVRTDGTERELPKYSTERGLLRSLWKIISGKRELPKDGTEREYCSIVSHSPVLFLEGPNDIRVVGFGPDGFDKPLRLCVAGPFPRRARVPRLELSFSNASNVSEGHRNTTETRRLKKRRGKQPEQPNSTSEISHDPASALILHQFMNFDPESIGEDETNPRHPSDRRLRRLVRSLGKKLRRRWQPLPEEVDTKQNGQLLKGDPKTASGDVFMVGPDTEYKGKWRIAYESVEPRKGDSTEKKYCTTTLRGPVIVPRGPYDIRVVGFEPGGFNKPMPLRTVGPLPHGAIIPIF